MMIIILAALILPLYAFLIWFAVTSYKERKLCVAAFRAGVSYEDVIYGLWKMAQNLGCRSTVNNLIKTIDSIQRDYKNETERVAQAYKIFGLYAFPMIRVTAFLR